MPEITPSCSDADRNLLFALLALQMEFVGKERLVGAMQDWMLDRTRPLGEVLVHQGHLSRERCQLLSALVEEHLKAHDHSPRAGSAGTVVDPGSLDAEATLPHAGPLPDSAVGVRYRILRPHAKGGLGELFVAEDRELHREVALKEIQPRYADDAVCRGRFLLEAEVTGRLEHPGIVPVYGLGCYADGRPFYAMRLVQGETLGEAIRHFHQGGAGERRLELRRLLARFVAVCNAVAYAHSRGIIHRDLKPANIMLGKFGETVVLDWGLAKVVGRPEGAATAGEDTLHPLSGDTLATQAGSTVGTAAFMSPEQAAGRLDQQGPASDVYSLGATLSCLLTGRPPLEGDLAEVLRRAQTGDWPAARSVNRNVPAPLDAICKKAMALAPGDRYATALELGAEVERWLADEPVRAWPEPAWVRLGRWARRRPLLSAWLAFSGTIYLALLVTLAAAVVSGFLKTPAGQAMVVLPVAAVLLAALGMSVGAQVAAVVGAAVGSLLGILTSGWGERRGRATRWGAAGGKVGLAAGAVAGYYGALGLWLSIPTWAPGYRAAALWVVGLGLPLGVALGFAIGHLRSRRLPGAVTGGLAAASLATVATCIFMMMSAQQQLQGVDLDRVRDHYTLIGALVRLERHAEAVRAAEELAERGNSAAVTYDAASFVSRCIPLARKDARLTAEEREQTTQGYGQIAVKLLREAHRKGYRNLDRLRQDEDLDPIRERLDFQEFLSELEKDAGRTARP